MSACLFLAAVVMGFLSEGLGGGPVGPSQTPDQRVELLFLIDEGIGGVELTSAYGADIQRMRTALDKIMEGLGPLMQKYRVSVLLYPTHHYKGTGYSNKGAVEPLDRISPNLHEVFKYFREKQVRVYLEMHSSGIYTNQNGEIATLPPAPLHYGEKTACKGLPMDLETLTALKDAYRDTFWGIRFHELIGTNDHAMADRAAGKEKTSHAWVVQERVIKEVIEAAALCGLTLVWSDHSWNALFGDNDGVRADKAYWLEWVDYAIDRMGPERVTLNWANNGWPVHQYVTGSFRLRNYRGCRYGESVQSWFWQEMDCGTLRWIRPGGTVPEPKWYLYPELDMPVELMAAFSLRAVKNGAGMLQFEPAQYFFNANSPRWLPLKDVPANYEDSPDYSARLVLKRLTQYLLAPERPNLPSWTLPDYMDEDYGRFTRNLESAPAKRYYQTTLGIIDREGRRRYFDRYSSDMNRWIEQSEYRSRDNLFDNSLVLVTRINLTFSCSDEFLIVKRCPSGVIGEFHTAQQGLLLADPVTFSDNAEGTFVCAAPLNIFPEFVASLEGSADDMVVVRRVPERGTLNLSIYRCSTAGSVGQHGFQYVPIEDKDNEEYLLKLLGPTTLDAVHFKVLLPVRSRNVMLADGSRPADAGLLAVSENGDRLNMMGRVNGVLVDQTVSLAGTRFMSACTADIDGDSADEICLLLDTASGTDVRFVELQEGVCSPLKETIPLGTRGAVHIYSLRVGTYTQEAP